MKRKLKIISFCGITTILVAMMLSIKKNMLWNKKKENFPKDTVLIGEAIVTVPVAIHDEC